MDFLKGVHEGTFQETTMINILFCVVVHRYNKTVKFIVLNIESLCILLNGNGTSI